MAKENLVSVQLATEKVDEIKVLLANLIGLLSPKCISLTPDERRDYSRIGEKTENWSRKTIGYMKDQPDFTPAFIDAEETHSDFQARETMKPILNTLNSLKNMVDDTVLILGSDIYHSNLGYYQNVKLLASQNVNGAKAIYDDLKAKFPNNTSRKKKGNKGDE
jgi:hypothetical protein